MEQFAVLEFAFGLTLGFIIGIIVVFAIAMTMRKSK